MTDQPRRIHQSDIARWRHCARGETMAQLRRTEAARQHEDPVARLLNAANVISLDTRVVEWMGDNDPKALAQLRGAIRVVQEQQNQQLALRALGLRFAGVLDITFVDSNEEAALLQLLSDVAHCLSLRGRGKRTMRLGADVSMLLNTYATEVEMEEG